ncbi:MAG: hypothetical protein KatS3mg077_2896 [Candidatus Binatia bacterium]|nr:MAG: hypothetical protein KatS3mg077_2896 [Candidatus Binatia bacterium]
MVTAMLRVLCKLEDLSFLRFTPVSQEESVQLAERGFQQACARAGLPVWVFSGPKVWRRPEAAPQWYHYDWESTVKGAHVSVRVLVGAKGKVQWTVSGDIERMRLITTR